MLPKVCCLAGITQLTKDGLKELQKSATGSSLGRDPRARFEEGFGLSHIAAGLQ